MGQNPVHDAGISILEAVPGENRAVTCWITFRVPAEDARYRWLNFVVGVVKGKIDHATDHVFMKAYACVKEMATGPPAIARARRSAPTGTGWFHLPSPTAMPVASRSLSARLEAHPWRNG